MTTSRRHQIATFAKEGLELEITHLTSEAMTPELHEAASGIMAEGEIPAAGKASLLEEGTHFLAAKSADGLVGFAAYHFGFEVGPTPTQHIYPAPSCATCETMAGGCGGALAELGLRGG